MRRKPSSRAHASHSTPNAPKRSANCATSARVALASTGIPSQVVVIEPTGADTFVACRHHGTDLAVVFRERHNFAPGSTIHLQPDIERSHLFDAGSGQRLAA